MSTNLEYRERDLERQREKEKIDDRPAKLNEKKSDGELEREKFRLVHQMEPTISVWSDRNVQDQR